MNLKSYIKIILLSVILFALFWGIKKIIYIIIHTFR